MGVIEWPACRSLKIAEFWEEGDSVPYMVCSSLTPALPAVGSPHAEFRLTLFAPILLNMLARFRVMPQTRLLHVRHRRVMVVACHLMPPVPVARVAGNGLSVPATED